MGAFTGAQIKFAIGKNTNKACTHFERSKILQKLTQYSNNDVCLKHVDELPDRTNVNLSLALLAAL